MKQSALIARRSITRSSLMVGILASLCLSLGASLLSALTVRGECEEAASASIHSTQAASQTRALMTQTDAHLKSSAQGQSRVKRPLTHIAAPLENLNISRLSLLRRYSLNGSASSFYASFFFSWQQGRAPPRTI